MVHITQRTYVYPTDATMCMHADILPVVDLWYAFCVHPQDSQICYLETAPRDFPWSHFVTTNIGPKYGIFPGSVWSAAHV